MDVAPSAMKEPVVAPLASVGEQQQQQQQPAARPAGKAKTGAKDKSLAVTFLLKATAQHFLLLREVTSTIWKVWIMDAEDFVAKKVMDSMREYAKAIKGSASSGRHPKPTWSEL